MRIPPPFFCFQPTVFAPAISSPADRAAFRGRTLHKAAAASSDWDTASESGSVASGRGGQGGAARGAAQAQFAGVHRQLENTLYYM